MSEDKPYRLGQVSPSPRKASATYEQPNPRAPRPGLKIAVGFEQNNAPQGSTPLPNLPVKREPPPFRAR